MGAISQWFFQSFELQKLISFILLKFYRKQLLAVTNCFKRYMSHPRMIAMSEKNLAKSKVKIPL